MTYGVIESEVLCGEAAEAAATASAPTPRVMMALYGNNE